MASDRLRTCTEVTEQPRNDAVQCTQSHKGLTGKLKILFTFIGNDIYIAQLSPNRQRKSTEENSRY